MKCINRVLNFFGVLVYCVVVIILIPSCNFFTSNGNLGASNDIEDSKKRGVFVCEYVTPQNPYQINDTLSIIVNSVWLEHQWRYKGLFNQKAKAEKDGYQLIVITDKKSSKGYGDNWLIGLTPDSTFRNASYDALIADFKGLPTENVMQWKVQKSHVLSNSFHKIIIGKFELRKVD